MGFAGDVKDSVKAMGDQSRKVDSRGPAKTALRFVLIVFFFVLAGMTGRMIPGAYGLFDFEKAGFYYIPLALAFVWSFINIVFPLQQEKQVDHRINIPLDILFFLAFVVVAVLQTRAAAIAYHYYQNQEQYHIGPLFDMPPTLGTMFDAAPVAGAFGRKGQASSAFLTAISQGKMYTYITTVAFAAIGGLGFPIPRYPNDPDYLCPNWDSCGARDNALQGFNYVPKLGLATGIIYCILAALLLVQVAVSVIDGIKSKKQTRNVAAAT